MHEQEDGLADKPNLEYFVLSLPSDGLWLVDHHENWARDFYLEMCMRTNSWLTKIFVRWHDVEMFALSPRDWWVVYMSVLNCWVGWEPRRLVLVQWPSVIKSSHITRI